MGTSTTTRRAIGKWIGLLALFFFAECLRAQPLVTDDPTVRYQRAGSGYLSLDRGLVFAGDTDAKAAEGARRFFAEKGVKVDPVKKIRKIPALEWLAVEAVTGVPEGTVHGFRIEITSVRARMEYTSPRAAAAASRVLKNLYGLNSPSAPTPGKIRHHLPAIEVRGWVDNLSSVSFRLPASGYYSPSYIEEHLHEIVPPDADRVEILFTESDRGWLIPGESMRLIHPGKTIYRDQCYSYDQIAELYEYLGSHNMELVPVFDLETPNRYFEEATGHPVLSVEGFRFVRTLLVEFMEKSRFDTLCVILKDPRYRDQLTAAVGTASTPFQLIFPEEANATAD